MCGVSTFFHPKIGQKSLGNTGLDYPFILYIIIELEISNFTDKTIWIEFENNFFFLIQHKSGKIVIVFKLI